MRPTLRMLSESLVEQIVAEGMALLRDPGVRVHNEEARRLLAEAGADVDEGRLVARIPERIVRQALETTAREFDLFTLDGQPAVHYGGDDVHFDPGFRGARDPRSRDEPASGCPSRPTSSG